MYKKDRQLPLFPSMGDGSFTGLASQYTSRTQLLEIRVKELEEANKHLKNQLAFTNAMLNIKQMFWC